MAQRRESRLGLRLACRTHRPAVRALRRQAERAERAGEEAARTDFIDVMSKPPKLRTLLWSSRLERCKPEGRTERRDAQPRV